MEENMDGTANVLTSVAAVMSLTLKLDAPWA